MLIFIKFKDSNHKTENHRAKEYYIQDGFLTLKGSSDFCEYYTSTKHFVLSEILSIEINEK